MLNDAGVINGTGMVPCTENTDKPNRRVAVMRCLGVLASYIAGYMFIDAMSMENLYACAVNIALALLVIAWNEGIMIRQRLENKYILSSSGLIETRFWEGALLAISLCGYYSFSRPLSFFFEICIVIYMSMCATGHLLREETSLYLVIDAFKGVVNKPLLELGSRVKAILYLFDYLKTRKGEDNSEESSVSIYGVVAGILMVVIAIPVFLCVLTNLAYIDSNFSDWVDKVFRSLFSALDNLDISIYKIIFSIPIGLYIHSVIEGKLNSSPDVERQNEEFLNENIRQKHIVPFGFIISIVFVFIFTYIVFIAFQATNLFGVFFGIVPGTLTAADYARGGFFTLCRVIVINLGIMAAISVFCRKDIYESVAMKLTGAAFMAISTMFSVISVAKICLYISRFGYTSARFIALWASLALGGSCIAIIINLFTSKKTAKIWLMSSALLYILMNLFVIVMY
ncbi:MAG: DUF4173 domain-containing protein [Clostridia bacterium]|nr:DUF4173 domain-containing protein [Clostridia bacterium]